MESSLHVRTDPLYGKSPEQFLNIRRKGAFEGQVFFRNWMHEAEFRRMQRLALKVQPFQYFAVRRAGPSIDRIAEQRVADRRHMDPNLVGSAGFQTAFR